MCGRVKEGRPPSLEARAVQGFERCQGGGGCDLWRPDRLCRVLSFFACVVTVFAV